jgi:hypothetical protein
MERHVSEVEIDQLASLARNSGTHYQLRVDRRKSRTLRHGSRLKHLLSRVVSALKI